MHMFTHPARLLLAMTCLAGCGDAATVRAEASAGSVALSGSVEGSDPRGAATARVPSSAEADLQRYQASLPEHPQTLDGRLSSPDAVARTLLGALAASDTAALLSLAVSRAEYAYLVYPESPLMRAPYQQPVDVAWALHATPHAKGLTRLLQRLGGRSLAFDGMSCQPAQVVEGRNRYWTGCRVRFTVDGDPVEARLFTAIVARDGHLNVASYDNDF